MARHIYDAEPHLIVEIERGEAEFDGNAALFFLFQPIGVNSGQGTNKTGFTVIDVAGSA
jgi:hypothetical protein